MRKKVDSIIEVKSEDITITQSRRDWSIVTGKKDYPKPVYYKNRNTGAEYCHIAGGIGWPGSNNVPGYVLVIGVRKVDAPIPFFEVLEENEDQNIIRLLSKCVTLRERWGYFESSEILRYFYGDDQRYRSITTAFSLKIREKEDVEFKHGFWIYAPDDFDQPDYFEIYLRQIRECLTPDASGKKRLYLGDCDKLKNYLRNFSSASVIKQKAENFPSIMAMGGVVHTLLQRKPWQNDSQSEAFNLEFD